MNTARLVVCVLVAIVPVRANRLEAQDNKVLEEIVFGSCLDKTEHPLLTQTLKLPKDLFIFLGDNIYADTTDMQVMAEKYDALKTSRFFQTLRQQAPILATWDDHDFGMNDAGASYAKRDESQQLFLDWLDEPATSPRRQQAGVYTVASFGPDAQRIQIILLDTRYFRSPLEKGKHAIVPSGGPYVPSDDPQATMLGEVQWQWLEERLREPAQLRLIGSSIQFVPSAHGGESWANLPRERQRMLDLIRETKAGGLVFLSGDRHWCEFSRLDGPLGYPLYDFTASSMTEVHPRGTPTPNEFRFMEKTFHQPNVGQLSIDWNLADPSLTFRVLDQNGAIQLRKQVYLSELQPE